MEVADITTSVQKYFENSRFDFYQETIDKLNKLSGKITKIPEDEHILEAIRIHLCTHMDDYQIVLTTKEPKDRCYRELDLTEKQATNLMAQCYAIEHGSLDSICESDLPKHRKIFSVFDSKNNIEDTFFKTKQVYNASSLLLGIDNLKFLDHQNLDKFCKVAKLTHPYAVGATNAFRNYYKLLQTFPWQEKDRQIVFSGVTWHALGLTYTRDIDVLVVRPEKGKEYEKILRTHFESMGEDYDYKILLKDGDWHMEDGSILKYQKPWLTKILPNVGGAKDIFDVICNPKHHFHFMGIKFVSIEINLQKVRRRSDIGMFVDNIMMKKLNNLDVNPKPCIPNMKITQGKVTVYAGDFMPVLYKIISGLLRKWYDTYMSVDEIKKTLKECGRDFLDPQASKIPEDPEMKALKEYFKEVKRYYILNNCKDGKKLLNIELMNQTDINSWNDAHIDQVVTVDSSEQRYDRAIKHLKNYNGTTKIKVVKEDVDKSWSTEIVENGPYNCITFFFSLQYNKDLENVIKNIDKVSKSGTKLTIIVLDGDLVYKKLKDSNDRIEIRDEQEPLFGIYSLYKRYDQKSQVLVYFKKTFGIQLGSIEYLIFPSELTKKLEVVGFKLLEKTKFSDLNVPKIGLTDNHKKICEYYVAITYEKK